MRFSNRCNNQQFALLAVIPLKEGITLWAVLRPGMSLYPDAGCTGESLCLLIRLFVATYLTAGMG